MTTSNYRREFWQAVYTAYVTATKFKGSAGARLEADVALQELDKRFPEKVDSPSDKKDFEKPIGSPFFNIKEIAEETKLLSELLGAVGELKNIVSQKPVADTLEWVCKENVELKAIVDQYAAQLKEYRSGWPAKDIEIERLTREGLIKDQKLSVINEDFNSLLGSYNEKVVRIAELEKEVEGHKSDADRWHRVADLAKEQSNARITELEKELADLRSQYEDVLAPKAVTGKTAREWLEELPEPYRSQAIANAENPECELDSEDIASSLFRGLGFAFKWNKTPEGDSYWREAHRKLEAGEPLIAEDAPVLILTEEQKSWDALAASIAENNPISEKPTTVKGWLETLDEPYRSQALENLNNHVKGIEDLGVLDMHAAICSAFSWVDTPQGNDYWQTLAEKYIDQVTF